MKSRKILEGDGPDQRARLLAREQQEVRNPRGAGCRLHLDRHPEPDGLDPFPVVVVMMMMMGGGAG